MGHAGRQPIAIKRDDHVRSLRPITAASTSAPSGAFVTLDSSAESASSLGLHSGEIERRHMRYKEPSGSLVKPPHMHILRGGQVSVPVLP